MSRLKETIANELQKEKICIAYSLTEISQIMLLGKKH